MSDPERRCLLGNPNLGAFIVFVAWMLLWALLVVMAFGMVLYASSPRL